MYCHKCEKKSEDESARFCPQCGTELEIGQIIEPAVEVQDNESSEDSLVDKNDLDRTTQEELASRVKRKGGRRNILLWPVAVPILSLILTGCVGFSYYNHQIKVNQQVEHLKEKAEDDALKGKYKQALSSLKAASNLRPNYKVLQEDQIQIQKALELAKSISDITDSLKKQELEKADSKIFRFKDSLQNLKGPLYSPFHKQIEEKTTTLAVAKIKVEIDKLKTVDQLAGKLTALSSLHSAETDEVNLLIRSKIVNLTTKDAEKLLNEKQYSDAIKIVDKGLDYASKDSKLISFKDRIQKEQTAFENAEKKRIEQAMEVTAQEDLKNKTSAVSMENMDVYTDEYGDLHVTGEVKNTATVPISSITLYYTVYDLSGDTIGSDFMLVDSYYLEPGEVGSFNDTYYAVNQEANVNINHATWYLN